MGIEEMLAQMASEDRKPAISHVGQIARLREFKDRLDAGNRFQVGDLVTPRSDSPMKQKGEPHLVVDTRIAEYDWRCEEAGGSSFGAKFDTRVAHMDRERMVIHWIESVYFEPYDAAIHEKSDRERDYATA